MDAKLKESIRKKAWRIGIGVLVALLIFKDWDKLKDLLF